MSLSCQCCNDGAAPSPILPLGTSMVGAGWSNPAIPVGFHVGSPPVDFNGRRIHASYYDYYYYYLYSSRDTTTATTALQPCCVVLFFLFFSVWCRDRCCSKIAIYCWMIVIRSVLGAIGFLAGFMEEQPYPTSSICSNLSKIIGGLFEMWNESEMVILLVKIL